MSKSNSLTHRIRAAGLIVQEQRVLLVRHYDPLTHLEWWIPPGGGLEPEDASVWDCARREIYEETGLQATLERMIYVREFREPARNRHHFEVFFYVSATQGEAQLEVSSGEEADGKSLQLQELKWLSQEDLQPLKVYPLQLKKEFWEDWREGFPTIRYLEGN